MAKGAGGRSQHKKFADFLPEIKPLLFYEKSQAARSLINATFKAERSGSVKTMQLSWPNCVCSFYPFGTGEKPPWVQEKPSLSDSQPAVQTGFTVDHFVFLF